MSNPNVYIDPQLTGPYPAYFRVNREQIGEVMTELAGLSPIKVLLSELEFSRGDTKQPIYQPKGTASAGFNMSGINLALQAGELELNETWRNVYGSNDIVAVTHFTVAAHIAMLKAKAELGPRSEIRSNRLMAATMIGGVSGSLAGHNLSGGNLLGYTLGGVYGIYRGMRLYSNRVARRINRESEPIMERFMTNKAIAIALKGALDFDFRG